MTGTDRPVARKFALIAGFAVALVLDASSAAAQFRSRNAGDEPAVLKADEVIYDQDLDIVTASGHVEITQGERVLRADTVSLNRRANTISASGNVSLLDPTGDVVFADYVELTDDFRDGVIQNFRALLADQSRLAAVSARRTDGTINSARKVVYSPCDLCKTDPTRAPVWQIKAARATHDEDAHSVSYRDAWLEMFGVPVVYTPYLQHPDGTVKRESGLLAPTFGHSQVLGTLVSVPYFQTLGPSADITLEPLFITNDNPVAILEYRQRTEAGAYIINGSVTSAKRRDDAGNELPGEEVRGHVKGTGRFDINDDWRWGFDAARASDDTYLQRYKLLSRFRFLDQNTLTSNVFVEGFRNRNYAAANAYAFQGLRPTDNAGLTPYVLPLLEYNAIGEPGLFGGRFTFDANALSIYRDAGTRTQRFVTQGGWELPYVAPSGEIYTLSARVLGELYNVSNINQPNDVNSPRDDGVLGRAFPQISVGWRYPLVNQGPTFRTIIEPIVTFVAAPTLGDQTRFPNEDSLGVDYDVTNLFRPNRFAGFDRLEGGQRVVYGFNTDITRLTGGRANIFLGQSYRLQEQSAFPSGSGLEDQLSNIVGKLAFAPHPWLSLGYQFQLDKDNFTAQRSLVGGSIGPQAAQLSVGYTFIDRASLQNQNTDIEQISAVLSVNLTPFWRVQLREARSLNAADEGELIGGATLIYEDECVRFGFDLSRRRVGSRDDPPDTTVLFRITFRNLGEVRTQVY